MEIPIKASADITESANKLLSKPANAVGSLVGTLVEYVHNIPFFYEMQKYKIEAGINLEK